MVAASAPHPAPAESPGHYNLRYIRVIALLAAVGGFLFPLSVFIAS